MAPEFDWPIYLILLFFGVPVGGVVILFLHFKRQRDRRILHRESLDLERNANIPAITITNVDLISNSKNNDNHHSMNYGSIQPDCESSVPQPASSSSSTTQENLKATTLGMSKHHTSKKVLQKDKVPRVSKMEIILAKMIQIAKVAKVLAEKHDFDGAIQVYTEAHNLVQGEIKARGPADKDKPILEKMKDGLLTRIFRLETSVDNHNPRRRRSSSTHSCRERLEDYVSAKGEIEEAQAKQVLGPAGRPRQFSAGRSRPLKARRNESSHILETKRKPRSRERREKAALNEKERGIGNVDDCGERTSGGTVQRPQEGTEEKDFLSGK